MGGLMRVDEYEVETLTMDDGDIEVEIYTHWLNESENVVALEVDGITVLDGLSRDESLRWLYDLTLDLSTKEDFWDEVNGVSHEH